MSGGLEEEKKVISSRQFNATYNSLYGKNNRDSNEKEKPKIDKNQTMN